MSEKREDGPKFIEVKTSEFLALQAENARLLAANRALVEALERLVKRMDDCQLGPVNSGRDDADAIADEAQQARAILERVKS